MRFFQFLTVFLSTLTCFGLLASAHAASKKNLEVGWVEEVRLMDVDARVKAKLDTGAKTSSIDSEIIDIRKTGKSTKDYTGETIVFSVKIEGAPAKTFERPIRRYVRIKKKGGGYIRRPVIEMTFCIGDREVHEEVNLANRENFIYPVLIGRNMMSHAGLLINASQKMLVAPTCHVLSLPKTR